MGGKRRTTVSRIYPVLLHTRTISFSLHERDSAASTFWPSVKLSRPNRAMSRSSRSQPRLPIILRWQHGLPCQKFLIIVDIAETLCMIRIICRLRNAAYPQAFTRDLHYYSRFYFCISWEIISNSLWFWDIILLSTLMYLNLFWAINMIEER